MKYFTSSGSATVATTALGILVQANATLNGTLTVADGGTTVAVITNPTVGTVYRYYGFTGAVTVNPSTTCDVTVSILNHQG